MPQEKIIINFKAVGNKELTRAIRELDNATRGLQGKAKRYNNETVLGTKNNRLLANSFATLRSKILLVQFAMAMGIRQLIGFSKQAAKVESMGMAFNTLSGGTANATVAMSKLQKATDGTMSQFDLFQQANNAMILGVTKNSDEMAEMFDIAQRLGRALGRDTKSSVESLITGIGRQSRMMLDNIGIIVKADEAYKAYADGLGKSVDSLTDLERKQAFLNATMESAKLKLKDLPPEIRATQDAYDGLGASASDAAVNIGKWFAELVDLPSKADEAATALDFLSTHIFNINFDLLGMNEGWAKAREEMNLFVKDTLVPNSPLNPDWMPPPAFYLPNSPLNPDYDPDGLKKLEIQTKTTQKAYTNFARTISMVSSINKDASHANALVAKRAAQLEVVVNTASAVTNALKIPPPAGILYAASIGALGVAQIAKVEAAKFETGGLIGGRRHSQGGTMINAEQGEFVMSRSAVQSVGIENLNRMNEGGGGSAVTVNVSGNVLSQDFVEGELAENIKEAIRRGTDFGIS